MKHLIMAAVALWALFQLAGLFWSFKDRFPEGSFAELLEPPQQSIENPYQNGYYYLFGLTTAGPLDPTKAGYEMWVVGIERLRGPGRNENGPSRLKEAQTLSAVLTSQTWEADDPLNEFRKKDSPLHAAAGQHQVLLSRYEHWLGMPFEDRGFGYRITSHNKEIMATHRLYVAEGYFLDLLQGRERLLKDLRFWRTVLREAKTIGTKTLAQIIINDDLLLLTRILAKPTVDHAVLTVGLELTRPLSASEYSLRWPVRNQLALAVTEGRVSDFERDSLKERDSLENEWLLSAANLPPRAFDAIEHPTSDSVFNIMFKSTRMWNTYAAYYDALITASESGAKHLPRMHDITATHKRGMVETLVNPRLVEPDWEPFYQKLMETDARLRLTSLQIQLRRPIIRSTIPVRLAEVGSQYFDPFTGLPMLWSPTQQKLYSVGKDYLDDGGDPTFDISVPAIVLKAQTSSKQAVNSSSSPRAARR